MWPWEWLVRWPWDLASAEETAEANAIIWTGILAFLVAAWGVVSQRRVTRRQVTLEHLAGLENDEDFIKAKTQFLHLSQEPGGLAPWAEEAKESTEETQSIRLVLNNMELIAIGIQTGIIDYTLYRRFQRTTALRLWKLGAPFVHALRSRLNSDSLYHEYEEMARWLRDHQMPRRRRFLADFW